ncbi:MAG: T9SS type A sorting domain-containing protein [Bacteroidota bacterium]|jgi:hypothetical protein
MKKQLLFGVALTVGFAAFAQQNNRVSIPRKSVPFKRLEALKGDEAKKSGGQTPKSNAKAIHLNPVPNATTTIIGETQYDLQTNSSVGHRIVNHGDGTISAIWTICDAGSPYTNRGTGYNYYDGTGWQYPNTTNPVVITRFENLRTGFPDLGKLRGTKDVIVNHETAGYTIMEDTNSTKGAQPFTVFQTDATVGLGTGSHGAIWPRLAVGGNDNATLHVIANYSDTIAMVNGVKQPMVYSRSQDGGTTWDIKAVAMPGYDSTRTKYGSAEDYAIDAVGNNVAVVLGGLGEHVTLWKSSDNGTTFARTLVDSFEYAPDYAVLAPVDSILPTNDGSVAVALDASGKAHVAFGYSEVSNDAVNGAVFIPGSIGLMYWNESSQTMVDIPITLGAVDIDGDGLYSVGALGTDANAARYGNNSLLHKPSIGFDAAGSIYIAFSLPADNDSTPDGQPYRDIWAVTSSDGGATWSDAVNLTSTLQEEESFPVLAKNVDQFLHIVYQSDFEPGTALTNGDGDGTNTINYLKVDKSVLASVKENKELSFSVGQNYPNPFNGTTNFGVNLKKASNVAVSVTDIFGKQVMNAINFGTQTMGHHTFSMDCSKLSAGIYFYTVTCGTESVTKKMIIE